MTPDEFIEWLAPVAQRICKDYNLFPSACIAQGALESGWGRYIIGEYNLFGRKWNGWGEYIEVPTTEYYDGNEVHVLDQFQDYESLEQAIEDYCVLLTQEPVYGEVAGHYPNDLEGYVRELAQHYATDPDYADKLLATIRACGLEEYDE